jgi:hypothetical protein
MTDDLIFTTESGEVLAEFHGEEATQIMHAALRLFIRTALADMVGAEGIVVLPPEEDR